MIVIEMRDAAYDIAFDLLDEAKHNAKQTTLTLCELEDAMYECYEASKDESEYSDDQESKLDFISMSERKPSYRHHECGTNENDDFDTNSSIKQSNRLRSMRMRRNRMGRN